MTIDPENPKHLIADEGKLLLQKSSGVIMGNEVWMRQVVIDGKLVDDFVENYEEIDAPEPPEPPIPPEPEA